MIRVRRLHPAARLRRLSPFGRPGHPQRRVIDVSIRGARVYTFTRAAQKLRGHQQVEQAAAGDFVKAKETLRLRASEPQAGHFDEFAVYPPKQAISVDVLADDMLPNFGTHGRSIDRGNQAEESVCEMANAVK
jgi:hypothetical protein